MGWSAAFELELALLAFSGEGRGEMASGREKFFDNSKEREKGKVKRKKKEHTISQLSHPDKARHILIKHLEPTTVLLRLARVAEASRPIEDFGEGFEIDCPPEVSLAIFPLFPFPFPLPSPPFPLLIAPPSFIEIRKHSTKTYNPPQSPPPTRGSPPASGSVRTRGANRPGTAARHGRCRAYRRGRRLLCSLLMPK